MTTFEKNYIGKGIKLKDIDIIRESIFRKTLEENIKSHLVYYEGYVFMVPEIAALKETNQSSHTANISKKVPALKGSGKKKKDPKK